MGSSPQKEEEKKPQILINNIKYIYKIISNSTDLSKSNPPIYGVNEGEAAAPAQNICNQNSYVNDNNSDNFNMILKNGSADNQIIIELDKKGNLSIETKDGKKNINSKTNSIESTIYNNKDNNLESGNNIINNLTETNIKVDNNVGILKEKTKCPEDIKGYNSFFGKGEQQNFEEEKNKQAETNKGIIDNNIGGNNKYVLNDQGKLSIKEEDSKNTGTFGNPDLDKINEENNLDKKVFTNNYDKCYYDNDDLEMSQNILFVSQSNLNFKDKNDHEIFMKEVYKKANEGYFPLYLQIDNNKPSFCYVKQDSTLKPALNLYLRKNGITYKDEEYTLYNDGNEININAQLSDLNLKPFSLITNHP